MSIESFQNLPVSLSEQPPVSDLQWQGLAPSYLRLSLWVDSITTLLFTLLWLALYVQPLWPVNQTFGHILLYGGSALSLCGVLALGYTYLSFPRKAFALRQHDLSYRSGVFFQKCVTQPLLRIQHIELKRGPFERRLGLATLQVFSAGGAMHTFAVPGLSLAVAEQIRQFILSHKDGLRHD